MPRASTPRTSGDSPVQLTHEADTRYQDEVISEPDELSPDDGLSGRLELQKRKSKQQRCKRKRARSIRKGIEHYFERQQLQNQLGDDFEDDDFDDIDDEDSWYH